MELVTYTVASPTTEGQYDFSDFLLDMQKQEVIVAGASSVRVGPEPTATLEPAPTNTPEPTATPKPAATPEPTVTPDPTPTPALQPTSTAAVLPWATPMPSPTATATEGPATPAATAAPAAPVVENQEEEGGTPFYLWLPLALLVVALLVAIAVYMRMRR